LGPSPNKYPVAALEYLRQRHAPKTLMQGKGVSIRILNDMDWGGFITWYSSENLSNSAVKFQAHIDDRAALLGDAFLRNYLLNLRPEGDWQQYIEAADADYLLLKSEDPLVKRLGALEAFSEIYSDNISKIFVLNAEKGKA
jgi:hypothetical protein